MWRIVTLALLLAMPVRADVAGAVQSTILPRIAAFETATAALAGAAQGTCTPADLRPAYHAAFDAFLGIAHLNLGPLEDDGRGLAIAFWPDPKGLGARALTALVAAGDPAVLEPATFAEQSIAVRGLFTLERLLFAEPADPYRCALTRAVTADLARMAAEVGAGWRNGFAQTLLAAGSAGNTRYLDATEARQALFTQLIAGLDRVADVRLGRPLGTFDRPRPERAEARASGRSLRNVALALAALRDLAVALVPESPLTQAAFDRAVGLAATLDDPVLAGVGNPSGWLKVEILQQAARAARDAAQAEIGPALGVSAGFNSADGD